MLNSRYDDLKSGRVQAIPCDEIIAHFLGTGLTGRPLRFISVREYLIAYAPEERPLWVVAVMHGRRNPRVMAAILRGRE